MKTSIQKVTPTFGIAKDDIVFKQFEKIFSDMIARTFYSTHIAHNVDILNGSR